MAVNGAMGAKVNHRLCEGAKVQGALRNVWKESSLSVRAKVGVFDGAVVPSVLYMCKVWALV